VTIVREPAAERIGRRLERLALGASAEVAVTDERLGPAALSAGVDPAHLHLLPTWTRVPVAAESRAAARARLGWAAHRFTVVHAGPMGHHQDLATVVDAARLLAVSTDDDAGEDLGIVLVSEGPQRVALERRACGLGTVRFEPRPRTAAELARVLAAADVLLVTDAGASPAGRPTQLGLYLSAGRPVVAAVPESSAPAHELRRAGGAGLRVDPGDPAGLAGAVLRLRAEPHQRGVMSRAGQRYARTQLGRTAVLRRLDLVIDAALAGEPEGMTAHVGRTVESQAPAGPARAGRDC
jgi:glycosyltransferase involved in cell wall biosynthesis